MPDLGTYADVVLGSYAVSLALMAVLVVVSVMRARKVRRALEEVEARVEKNG